MASNATAQWVRNKTGNRALGTLYSQVTGRILHNSISLSHAKLVYYKYTIYEVDKVVI